MSELSWKARRRGTDIYCAPACGRGCTVAMHKAAIAAATKLAKRLNRSFPLPGGAWTIRVWENLGWHSEAVSPCGRIKIQATSAGQARRSPFTAFVGEPSSGGGRWAEHGKTPESAIRNTLAVGRAERNAILAILNGLVP